MFSQETINFINQCGFPIFAFLLMFIQNTVTINRNSKAINGLTKFLEKREKEK
jgi:hypothetical protein